MLVAISAAKELGFELSAFQIMPKLFYPMLLLVSSLIAIFGIKAGMINESGRDDPGCPEKTV